MKKYRFFIVVLLILFILSAKVFFDTPKKEYKVESRINNITEVDNDTSLIVLGWIKVQGTDIDYPIIYRKILSDNEGIDYLWSISLASDFRDEENRDVIYGHNLRNVSSKPILNDSSLVRFEQLMYFTDYKFAKENQYIQLTVDGKDELYKIYAVSFVSPLEDEGEATETKEETENYIKDAMERSLYDYHTDVNGDDDIISLITCTRFFGIDSYKTQFRVDARKVRENEKAINSRVTKTSNYDIIEEKIGGNNE